MPWPKNLKEIPAVKRVMTPFPYSVDQETSLGRALELMVSHGIHHLPVVAEGSILGVVSHAELTRDVATRAIGGEPPRTVGDIPLEGALVVDLSAPLDRVLQQMAEERLAVALVVKDERLAGIFTVTDACHHFAQSLRQQFPSTHGDDAA